MRYSGVPRIARASATKMKSEGRAREDNSVLYSFVKIVARHKFPAKTAALVAAALLAAMANAQYGGYTERGAPYRLGCLTRPQ